MKSTQVMLACIIVLVQVVLHGEALAQGWEVDLGGEWQFQAGDDARWAAPSFDDADWEKLHAPSLWDNQGYQDYDGFGWYRKRFSVPDDLKGKQLTFEHGGVDDDDWVYINGTKVGEGSGCYKPRSYLIPPGLLRAGTENLVAVHIHDGAMGGGLAVAPIKIREATLNDRVEVAALELAGGYGQENLSLHVEIANREDVPHRLQCAYSIRDYFGRSRAAGEIEFDLPPGGALSREIQFPASGCTRYRARLDLTEDGQSMDVFRYLVADAKGEARGTLNLSGEWEMLAPADDELVFPPTGEWQAVQVPTRGYGGWEGQNHRAWFRRSVALPGDMRGKRLKLRFEAVAHHAQVYVNGRKLAEHLGGFEPFEVDITSAARWDEPNEVLVGVTDWVAGLVEGFEPWGGGRRGPNDSMVIPYGSRPPTRRGIWDDVYLRAHNEVSIGDVFPITSLREEKLQLQVRGHAPERRLRWRRGGALPAGSIGRPRARRGAHGGTGAGLGLAPPLVAGRPPPLSPAHQARLRRPPARRGQHALRVPRVLD